MLMTKWKLLVLAAYCVSGALSQNTCQKNRLNAVKNLESVVQGVNLGSWFVVESWMVPELFDNNGCSKSNDGQYLLEKCLGSNASSVLQKHWSTWITEADFKEMSSRGVNLVRVTNGWWQIYDPMGGADKAKLNYDISPKNYQTGSLDYLDKTFEWALKYGIGVLIDMHAAPGSQNGQPHSSPASPGEQDWDKNTANVGQTVDSLELFAERYGKHEALFGFAVLNEPNHIDIDLLQDYYKRAYQAIRKHSADSWIVISPLNSPYQWGTESTWTGFMNSDQNYSRVSMDLHLYSCFGSGGDQTTATGCINYIKYDTKSQIANYKKANSKPLLIGEWSACWHATDGEDRIGEFVKAQVDSYNTANLGWTFWAWAPGTSGNKWSLKTAFEEDWLGNLNTPC